MKALGLIGNGYVLNRQGFEYLHCSGTPCCVGQVVIACDKKNGDVAGTEPLDTSGELALVGLAGVTALVGVAAEEGQVHVIVQRVVHELIESGEVTVANLPAYQSIARFEAAGTERQRQRVHLIDAGRLYFIIADAVPAEGWDRLAGIFSEAIQSVELFEAQPIEEAQ